MDLILPTIITTTISTVLTEILKFFPILGKTDLRKKILAFIVCLVVSGVYVFRSATMTSYDWAALFFLTLFYSYLAFKTIVQAPEISFVGKS